MTNEMRENNRSPTINLNEVVDAIYDDGTAVVVGVRFVSRIDQNHTQTALVRMLCYDDESARCFDDVLQEQY
jgi:hypothetical protein